MTYFWKQSINFAILGLVIGYMSNTLLGGFITLIIIGSIALYIEYLAEKEYKKRNKEISK